MIEFGPALLSGLHKVDSSQVFAKSPQRAVRLRSCTHPIAWAIELAYSLFYTLVFFGLGLECRAKSFCTLALCRARSSTALKRKRGILWTPTVIDSASNCTTTQYFRIRKNDPALLIQGLGTGLLHDLWYSRMYQTRQDVDVSSSSLVQNCHKAARGLMRPDM